MTAAAVCGALVALAPEASAAPVTGGASAFASAALLGANRTHAALSLSGTLSALLGQLVGPIVNNTLNPLVTALDQRSANTAVDAAFGPSSPLSAPSPTTQSTVAPGTFPGDVPGGLPSPCSASSAPQPCYRAAGAKTGDATPLAKVTASGIAGYTQQTASPPDSTLTVFGRSQVASASVNVLSAVPGLTNPAVTTGVVDARSTCPNDGTTDPSADVSATAVSVLGGVVALSVGNDAISSITVNGRTYGSVTVLPTVTVAGVTVAPYGNSVAVSLPISLHDIAVGLGLDDATVTALTGYAVPGSSSLTLTLTLGPNESVTRSNVAAWGLGIGVDLSGSLSFNLLNLVGATITVPSGLGGSSNGNLLDLRLAYSACSVGSTSLGAGLGIPPSFV